MALIESAGAVLYTEDGGVRQYVLVMEKNGSFGLPKGHVEPGEMLAETALREVWEETGICAILHTMQPVMVDEPTVEDTISILRGLKERYEVFHGVKITDSALVAAATLSHRYITDRFLPDKAIDLVDEACALIKTELDSMPTELDELNRRVMQMEIEETALKKETDRLSQERLADLQKELAELRD